MRGNTHVRFGGAGRGNGPTETVDTASRPDPYSERRDRDQDRAGPLIGMRVDDGVDVRVSEHDEAQHVGDRPREHPERDGGDSEQNVGEGPHDVHPPPVGRPSVVCPPSWQPFGR
jgi:hypothetical protein